jgi:hypothetical protein
MKPGLANVSIPTLDAYWHNNSRRPQAPVHPYLSDGTSIETNKKSEKNARNTQTVFIAKNVMCTRNCHLDTISKLDRMQRNGRDGFHRILNAYDLRDLT